jgi:DNA-binding CsgD family transcriptional regulator
VAARVCLDCLDRCGQAAAGAGSRGGAVWGSSRGSQPSQFGRYFQSPSSFIVAGRTTPRTIVASDQGELHLDPAVAKRLMSSMRASRHEDPGAELTDRKREILRRVAAGKANKQIAAELVISERTARTHVSNILRKLNLSSRTQAALWAVREGLAESGDQRPS